MLVLLLSIFQHRRRAGYRTGQTHSCLRLPPLWRGGGTGCLTDTMISHHIQSAPSCLFLFFLESQPLIQSAAPGCPRSWDLAGGWGTGRPLSRGSPLLWQHWGGCLRGCWWSPGCGAPRPPWCWWGWCRAWAASVPRLSLARRRPLASSHRWPCRSSGNLDRYNPSMPEKHDKKIDTDH